jgi:hypothetical protein
MNTITESTNPERDGAIIASSRGGVSTADIAKAHNLSVGRVQQIIRQQGKCEPFELFIADKSQKISIANVYTSRGFLHACRLAMRQYSATFARLELPSWHLVAGADSIPLNSPDLA